MKTSIYNFSLRTAVKALMIVGAVLFGACSEDAPKPVPEEPETPETPEVGETPVNPEPAPMQRSRDIVLSKEEAELADATIATAFKLFQAKSEMERREAEPQANIVFSPLSISWIMSMLANGTAGETQEQIISGLGYEGHSMNAINSFFSHIVPTLKSIDPTSSFNNAKSMWMVNSVKPFVRDEFINTLKNEYDSPTMFIGGFDNIKALTMINDWYSNETNGFIDQILVPPLNDAIYLIMADALYFKGHWVWPFNPDKTVDAVFHNEDGSESTVKMMEGESMDYAIRTTEDFLALRLPFGNEAFVMIFIIPHEGIDIDRCIAAVCENVNLMRTMAGGLVGGRLHLPRLPKFDFSFQSSYRELLKQHLGITDVFSRDKANLSGMFDLDKLLATTGQEQKNIADIFQKSRISVDETKAEGGVASYALGVEDPDPIPYEITVDRPFIFLISERSTGLPIFMGRVTKL